MTIDRISRLVERKLITISNSLLLVPPKITPFSFGEEPMNFEEPVSVTCTISGGDLPINVIWTLNRVPIEPSMGILTEKRGKRIYALTIESVKAEHAGNFTCLAENIAGITEHTSQLVVNGSATKTNRLFSFICSISFFLLDLL